MGIVNDGKGRRFFVSFLTFQFRLPILLALQVAEIRLCELECPTDLCGQITLHRME